MIVKIYDLTGGCLEPFSKLLRKVIFDFPELDDFYNVIYCFLLAEASQFAYKRELIEAGFPLKQYPENYATCFSFGTKGRISIRVDLMQKKEIDFQEFVMSEECCHLIEQKGNCNPCSTSFLELKSKFMARNNTYRKSAEIVNEAFSHFKINQMLFCHNFEQWLTYRKSLYGPDFRKKLPSFCNTISGLDEKEQILKLYNNLLNVVSFYYVIQEIKNQQKSPSVQIILNNMQTSLEETIKLIENTISRINPNIPKVLNLFPLEVFQIEEEFWKRILILWSKLKI